MTAIKNYHPLDVSQQLHAVKGVHSSSLCVTFRINCRRRVHYDHAVHIVVAIITEGLEQRAVVCSVDVAKRFIWIPNLIHPRVVFLVKIVVEVQGENLNVSPNFIRSRCVALQRVLDYTIHYKRNHSLKE